MKNTIRKGVYFSLLVPLFLFFSIAFRQKVEAAVTKLDTTFNTTGYTTFYDSENWYAAQDVQIQNDGRVVVAGFTQSTEGDVDLMLWRYNSDGTLDTTFNGTGYVIHNNAAGGNDDDFGFSLVIDASGKYVIAGASTGSETGMDLVVWRFNSNGTLDSGFGDGSCSNGVGPDSDMGCLVHRNAAGGDGVDEGNTIKEQGDGKYVVAGDSYNGTDSDLVLWRITTNGELDATFGDGSCNNGVGASNDMGCIVYDQNEGAEYSNSLQIQSNGKYVIAGAILGETDTDLIVWRLNNDGSLDSTFGDGTCPNGVGPGSDMGCVTHDNAAGGGGNDEGVSLQILSDGKYVIAGSSVNSLDHVALVLWRYTANGTLDASFNGIGYVVNNDATGNSGDSFVSSLQIQSDGRYVVVGFTDYGQFRLQGVNSHFLQSGKIMHLNNISNGNSDLIIWRFTTNGTVDTSFNNNGFLAYNMSPGTLHDDIGTSFQIQSDGKYLIAGVSFEEPYISMTLWRFENLYQISGLSSALDAKVEDVNIETGTPNGTYGSQTVKIYKDGFLVAEISADMVEDRNWSDLSADINFNSLKSFVHNLSGESGTAATFSLYIPKGADDKGVGICPNAFSFTDINPDCPGLIYYREGDSNVSIVSVDGQTYWKVSGLSGTGGFSSNLLAISGQDIQLTYFVVLGFCGMCLVIYLSRLRREDFFKKL